MAGEVSDGPDGRASSVFNQKEGDLWVCRPRRTHHVGIQPTRGCAMVAILHHPAAVEGPAWAILLAELQKGGFCLLPCLNARLGDAVNDFEQVAVVLFRA